MLFDLWKKALTPIIPWEIPWTAFGRGMSARREIIEHISVMVKQCDGLGDDFLSAFVSYRDEEGKALTRDEICDNILMVMIAGHGGTAAASASLTGYLYDPCNSDVLKKLRNEVHLLGEPTDAALKDCEYLCAVIDETLRARPPISSSTRIATKDMILSDGTIIPRGLRIATSAPLVHNDESIWGPSKFNPERMVIIKNEQPEVLRSYFFPFGGGSRMCAGEHFARMELRMFVYHLVKHWTVKIEQSHRSHIPVNTTVSTFRLQRFTPDA
jgi:cytochrome P450